MLGINWNALVCGALIAVSAHAGPEIGDYSGLPKDLAAAAIAYDVAQFKSNRAELERLLADDYVLAGTSGRNQTKAESLIDATAARGTDKSVVISQQVTRAWPNGAALAGVVDASELVDGRRTSIKARFVDIWAKRNGRWQVIFTQIDAVNAQAAAPIEASSDCTAVSTPHQQKDEDTIRRIEQGWLTAELQGNPKFLECLLEPDYRTSGRNGKARSRQDVIDRVAKIADSTRAVPELETIAFVHGDTASAHSILRTTDKAGNPKEIHFVDSYTFHDGRWHAFSGADL